MPNPMGLRREAEEALNLARIVSYAEDKKRLSSLAERLKRQADELELAQQDRVPEPPPPTRIGVISWLHGAKRR